MKIDDMIEKLYLIAIAPMGPKQCHKGMKEALVCNGFALVDISAALKVERGVCADIAEAVDSKRGNEMVIAEAIRDRGKT